MSRYGYYVTLEGRFFQVDFSTEFNSPQVYNGREYDRIAFKAKAIQTGSTVADTLDVYDEDFVPVNHGDIPTLDRVRRKDIPVDILWAFPNKPAKATM